MSLNAMELSVRTLHKLQVNGIVEISQLKYMTEREFVKRFGRRMLSDVLEGFEHIGDDGFKVSEKPSK
jgi:DNA-directed RNA polymerase alpha subunit